MPYIDQARSIITRHTAHGMNKIAARKLKKISSVGTERNFRRCLANYLKWCNDNAIPPDRRANLAALSQYLEERSEWVKQKTLNQERQALQFVYEQQLPYYPCLQETILDKRSYLLSEVNLIVKHQSEKNQLTTWLAFFAGLRAHESATLLPIEQHSESTHRIWDHRRFMGLANYCLYTVAGKGGLVRAIAVPLWLSRQIEARRLLRPVGVKDREINYQMHYDLGFGQSWSQSFTTASKKALGKSNGAHGLRHGYAKWRLKVLIDALVSSGSANPEQQALLILSQELGHFRMDIVFCYLR